MIARPYRMVAFLLLIAAAICGAQDGTFAAAVDRTTVSTGDQLQLTFSLSGSTSPKNFRPPSFDDFMVLTGPNQSTNVQFVNGAVSQSISLTYILQPKKEGKFTIGSASIELNGKTLQSQPIVITVAKGAPPPAGGQAGGKSAADESAELTKQIGDNLFLKVVIDKSHVVQGEQITATYKLYNRVSLANLSYSKTPSLTGFWSEDIEDIKQVQFTREVLNGRQYNVAVLKKVALFPQRSGTLEIDPMEVNCVVQVRNKKRSNNPLDQFFNDPFFDDPFFGGGVSNVNYKVKSEPVKITVAALPSANVPEGFGGAVGKFTMESWLDKKETKTNDPVTLKVKISGRGNLKLLEAPALKIPPDIEKYDPKISDNVAREGDQLAGSRTFEYLLIPRHAGTQHIPSFPFSYYDVDKRGYMNLTSPEFVVEVAKGAEMAGSSSSGISKEDVKLLGEDIRFIKSEGSDLGRRGERFAGSPVFFLLSFGPVLSFIGLFVLMRKRERALGDVVSLKRRKARKMARRRLVEAKKLLHQKKREDFYTEVSRALWGYVADKLSIPPADCSADMVRAELTARGVPPELIANLITTIEQCNFARFAPSSESVEMDNVYRGAVDLISTIEDHAR